MRQGSIMKELVKRRITTYRLRYDWAANTAEVDLPTEDDEKEEQDNLTLKSRVRCRQARPLIQFGRLTI